MIDLVLTRSDYDQVSASVLDGATERCAVLFTRQVRRTNGSTRLLVHGWLAPDEDDYSRRGVVEAELKPGFVARVSKHARTHNYGLVFVHSHPGKEAPSFSMADDEGEVRLASFLAVRNPAATHAAVVISAGGISARQLGTGGKARVVVIGHNREVVFDPSSDEDTAPIFDRQVRAFGAAGQAALKKLKIAIVGLGGTGSLVAQQLAHLGIANFVLVDPDVIEETNLNRVVGATPADVGIAKVLVAEKFVCSIHPAAEVTAIEGDITRAKIAARLTDADVIFGCTDSHGSRSVLQQIAYQYLIPCIDMGTVIVASQGKVSRISGRVQLLAPGSGCFTCSGLLNPEEVRRDMMTSNERQADPYIRGAREPAPAVISINGTVVSLAVTMLLSMVSGVPGPARQIIFDGLRSTLRSVQTPANPDCYICSRTGALAQGDTWPLMARQD